MPRRKKKHRLGEKNQPGDVSPYFWEGLGETDPVGISDVKQFANLNSLPWKTCEVCYPIDSITMDLSAMRNYQRVATMLL